MVTRSELKTIASKVLEVLDKEDIQKMEDLEKIMGKTFPINETDSVVGEVRPSNFGTPAFALSYFSQQEGIVLETRLNASSGYTLIILKSETEVEGYESAAIDPLGNTVQSKTISPADVGLLRKELELLKEYQDIPSRDTPLKN